MSTTDSLKPATSGSRIRLAFELRFVAYETTEVVDELLKEKYPDEQFGQATSAQPYSPLITLLSQQIKQATGDPCCVVDDDFNYDLDNKHWEISGNDGLKEGDDSTLSNEEYLELVESICGVFADEMDCRYPAMYRQTLKDCKSLEHYNDDRMATESRVAIDVSNDRDYYKAKILLRSPSFEFTEDDSSWLSKLRAIFFKVLNLRGEDSIIFKFSKASPFVCLIDRFEAVTLDSLKLLAGTFQFLEEPLRNLQLESNNVSWHDGTRFRFMKRHDNIPKGLRDLPILKPDAVLWQLTKQCDSLEVLKHRFQHTRTGSNVYNPETGTCDISWMESLDPEEDNQLCKGAIRFGFAIHQTSFETVTADDQRMKVIANIGHWLQFIVWLFTIVNQPTTEKRLRRWMDKYSHDESGEPEYRLMFYITFFVCRSKDLCNNNLRRLSWIQMARTYLMRVGYVPPSCEKLDDLVMQSDESDGSAKGTTDREEKAQRRTFIAYMKAQSQPLYTELCPAFGSISRIKPLSDLTEGCMLGALDEKGVNENDSSNYITAATSISRNNTTYESVTPGVVTNWNVPWKTDIFRQPTGPLNEAGCWFKEVSPALSPGTLRKKAESEIHQPPSNDKEIIEVDTESLNDSASHTSMNVQSGELLKRVKPPGGINNNSLRSGQGYSSFFDPFGDGTLVPCEEPEEIEIGSKIHAPSEAIVLHEAKGEPAVFHSGSNEIEEWLANLHLHPSFHTQHKDSLYDAPSRAQTQSDSKTNTQFMGARLAVHQWRRERVGPINISMGVDTDNRTDKAYISSRTKTTGNLVYKHIKRRESQVLNVATTEHLEKATVPCFKRCQSPRSSSDADISTNTRAKFPARKRRRVLFRFRSRPGRTARGPQRTHSPTAGTGSSDSGESILTSYQAMFVYRKPGSSTESTTTSSHSSSSNMGRKSVKGRPGQSMIDKQLPLSIGVPENRALRKARRQVARSEARLKFAEERAILLRRPVPE